MSRGPGRMRRSLLPWSGFVLTVVLVMGIAVLVEIIAYRHNQRLDLTPGKDYSLSPQTISVLENLDQDLRVTVFYKGGNRSQHEEMLRRFAMYTPRLDYRLLHLDRNPSLARLQGVSAYGQTVVESRARKLVIASPSEGNLLNAILKLTSRQNRRIIFSTGHGEQSPGRQYAKLARALRMEAWTVESVNLSTQVPASRANSVLVVAGPRRDFLPGELKRLEEYLRGGGNLVIMLEPFSRLAGLDRFLQRFRIVAGRDIIIDKKNKLMGRDYLVPLIPYFARGPITGSLRSAAVFPTAGSVVLPQTPGQGLDMSYLAMSSPASWSKSDEQAVREGRVEFQEGVDRKGPIPVAAMVSLGRDKNEAKGRRLVCFGDSDFLRDPFLEILANKDLFLNTVDWLTQEGKLVSLRKRQYNYPYHSMTKQQGIWAFILFVILLPGIAMLLGITVLVYRKWNG